jgi:hypothetical protein
MTLQLKENILKRAEDRQEIWEAEVSNRQQSCSDLMAEEAIYHSTCIRKFMTKTKMNQVGRPPSKGKTDAFNMVCDWLERDGDCELHTVKELMSKILQSCFCTIGRIA